MDLAVSLESYHQSESAQLPFSNYFQNRDAKRFISPACRCSTFTDVATSVNANVSTFFFFFFTECDRHVRRCKRKLNCIIMLLLSVSFVPGRHDCVCTNFPMKHKKRMQHFPSLGCWIAAHWCAQYGKMSLKLPWMHQSLIKHRKHEILQMHAFTFPV